LGKYNEVNAIPVDRKMPRTTPAKIREKTMRASKDISEELLKEALENSYGWVAPAAAALNAFRPVIYRKIAEYGLEEWRQSLKTKLVEDCKTALVKKCLEGNVTALKYMLNNMCPEEFSERTRVDNVSKVEYTIVPPGDNCKIISVDDIQNDFEKELENRKNGIKEIGVDEMKNDMAMEDAILKEKTFDNS
jgi:hypothetical protein